MNTYDIGTFYLYKSRNSEFSRYILGAPKT